MLGPLLASHYSSIKFCLSELTFIFFPLVTDSWTNRQIDKQIDSQIGTISITAIHYSAMAWLVICLFLKVLEALDRLATFEMAFGIERFRCVFSVSLLFYLNICENGYLLCFYHMWRIICCCFGTGFSCQIWLFYCFLWLAVELSGSTLSLLISLSSWQNVCYLVKSQVPWSFGEDIR